jgi:glycine cleavage system H protein
MLPFLLLAKGLKLHLWSRIKLEVLGITDYAQDQLNEILFVDTPDEGATFETGESFGDVESLKAVNELYMPASGTIKAVNDELEDCPTLLNESPYDKGWIIQIEFDDIESIQSLLSAAKYIELTEN